MARFVSPLPELKNLPRDSFAELFRDSGLPAHATALARLCRAFLQDAVEDPDPELEQLLEYLAEDLREYANKSTDVVLLRAGPLILKKIRHNFGIDSARLGERLVAALPSMYVGVDVPGAVRAIFKEKNGVQALAEEEFVRALVLARIIEPADFMDAEAIRETAKGPAGKSWSRHARDRDPRLPDYWMQLDPEVTIASCRKLLEREPIETLGFLAGGFEQILWRYPREDLERSALSAMLEPILQLLCKRRRDESAEQDRLLTKHCWLLGARLESRTPALLEGDYAPLREVAFIEMGRLRSWLRSDEAPVTFEDHAAQVNAAAFFVLRTDTTSPWDVLRRFLLALRELPQRGVALDLRTWHEPEREAIPHLWGWLPSKIAHILEEVLPRELERDADLHEFRRQFAQYCLDRLKTREKTKSSITADLLVEPEPSWRCGYIHAAQALHANLGERGYQVLRWSQDHDPDEEVREAAKSAYATARRGHGLPAEISPRSAVLLAFWWLRQAHVIALGETPDERGAQRTHRKEMRRQVN